MSSMSLALPLLTLILILLAHAPHHDSPFRCASDSLESERSPNLYLWTWERNEDVRFIDPSTTGVAFLAETIHISDGGFMRRPRRNYLLVPAHCPAIAVVRIEARDAACDLLSSDDSERLVTVFKNRAFQPGVRGLQIDFDATVRQRPFYIKLLRGLRSALGKNYPLSITALGSWCLHDRWIEGLPIDEAVPMLFRMGRDGQAILRYIDSGGDFLGGSCTRSYGISTDEPRPILRAGRRVFVFHPRSWSKSEYEKLESMR
jgi:hypothetical protein